MVHLQHMLACKKADVEALEAILEVLKESLVEEPEQAGPEEEAEEEPTEEAGE